MMMMMMMMMMIGLEGGHKVLSSLDLKECIMDGVPYRFQILKWRGVVKEYPARQKRKFIIEQGRRIKAKGSSLRPKAED